MPSTPPSLRKTWPRPETQSFSLPLSGSLKTHTHFLLRHNHLIFKPHIAGLGNGRSDFWKRQTFRVEFRSTAHGISILLLFVPHPEQEKHVSYFSNVTDCVGLTSLSSPRSCFIYSLQFVLKHYIWDKYFINIIFSRVVFAMSYLCNVPLAKEFMCWTCRSANHRWDGVRRWSDQETEPS